MSRVVRRALGEDGGEEAAAPAARGEDEAPALAARPEPGREDEARGLERRLEVAEELGFPLNVRFRGLQRRALETESTESAASSPRALSSDSSEAPSPRVTDARRQRSERRRAGSNGSVFGDLTGSSGGSVHASSPRSEGLPVPASSNAVGGAVSDDENSGPPRRHRRQDVHSVSNEDALTVPSIFSVPDSGRTRRLLQLLLQSVGSEDANDSSQLVVSDGAEDDEDLSASATRLTDRNDSSNLEEEKNAAMVRVLRSRGFLTAGPVEHAFLQVPRGLFLPREFHRVAYQPHPVRLPAYNFNVSSPDVYATALEALGIQAGDRVLDVGSGCGMLTAMAAYLAGSSGVAIGIDLHERTLSLARDNMARLMRAQPDYASSAGAVYFMRQNAFLLSRTDFEALPPNMRELVMGPSSSDCLECSSTGVFDKIHSGAACAPEHLTGLVRLLRPGGVLVTPSDERMLKLTLDVSGSGRVKREPFGHVRYGNLVVPAAHEQFAAHARAEEMACCTVKTQGASESTYVEDFRAHAAFVDDELNALLLNVRSLSESCTELPDNLRSLLSRRWREKDDCDTVLRIYSAGSDSGIERLQAHRLVLCARSGHFRALYESEMRDSNAYEVTVPAEFPFASVSACVEYLYTDQIDPMPHQCASILAIARYYDLPTHLVGICEARLASVLDPDNATDILITAMQNACDGLKRCAASYIMRNFEAVRRTEAWLTLDAAFVSEVLAFACTFNSKILTFAHPGCDLATVHGT
mmetsp:Transcript_13659/g.36683  ORF Transcript_13659/g.36683 Transcript_13659/m.36683 type:complete len:754 (+) Transcript_13659:75-2336(+)